MFTGANFHFSQTQNSCQGLPGRVGAGQCSAGDRAFLYCGAFMLLIVEESLLLSCWNLGKKIQNILKL